MKKPLCDTCKNYIPPDCDDLTLAFIAAECWADVVLPFDINTGNKLLECELYERGEE